MAAMENTVLKAVTVCSSERPEVSEKHGVSIFRVEEYVKLETNRSGRQATLTPDSLRKPRNMSEYPVSQAGTERGTSRL
jgi:hypothetical protein